MHTTLLVGGISMTPMGNIYPLGKLAIGTKIQIQMPVTETMLCFTQEPRTNAVQPKADNKGLWLKNLTVVKLDDGTVAVQGWPGNGMYTAKHLGEGKGELTFHAIVRFHAEFYYVEDSQIVVFHDLLGSPYTTQMRGLRPIVDYIISLIAGDTLPKATPITDPEVGTVLWYSAARNIGAVVTGTDQHDELVLARVHVTQILGQEGLPVLHAGDTVSWQDTKDLGEGTAFKTELLGVTKVS